LLLLFARLRHFPPVRLQTKAETLQKDGKLYNTLFALGLFIAGCGLRLSGAAADGNWDFFGDAELKSG